MICSDTQQISVTQILEDKYRVRLLRILGASESIAS